ncbi:MAG TPA: heterocyst formation ABC transporter subunit HepA [Rhodothermales bacterium]|nr:heterocyst formation ABC transporter subunit HepA [Rhodothermales bacterium]
MLIRNENRILLESFRKYAHLIVITVFLSLLAAVFEGFSIGLLIPFLKNIADPSAQQIATGWHFVDHWMLGSGLSQVRRMYRICGFILVCTWLRAILGYLSSVYGMKSRALVVEDLRMRVIDQLQAVSLRFFSKTRSGELINSLTTELARISHSLNVTVTLITRGFFLVVYGVFVIVVSWQLSLIVVVSFGLMSLALTRLITLIRISSEKVTRAHATFVSHASEFISGIRTVTAFNMQTFERERLNQATSHIASAVIETTNRALLVSPLTQAVVGTVLIAVIVLAVQFYVLAGALDMALLLAFLFALFRMMPVVQQLNGLRGEWASMGAALSSIANLLRREDKPYLADGSIHTPAFRNSLVFEHIWFAYEPGEPVLEDISLKIERGKTTALIGASGAGKSTLVDLIPRFFDPSAGRILMDGIDLREFKVASLRQKIAVVSQAAFVFNDTVRANIAYGVPAVSDAHVRAAAERANALDFIEEMPDGFETVLGDQGVRLSGGQRQRIAIARALLRDPEILILDEATSALDSISERLVQQSLERLMEGRTVIAIAHRLSTVEHADWVVVLERGRVVEQGTYEELLARRGQLWKYHSLQFQPA